MMRQIPGFENYCINESGIVLDNTKHIVRSSINKDGRLYTTLNGINVFIDELVAKTFLAPPTEKYCYLCYRDNSPLNCHYSNLYWNSYDKSHLLDTSFKGNRYYSSSKYLYQIYNEDESIVIECIGRGEVADKIQYEEISLKNMVGNGTMIMQGPYKGFMIRRVTGSKIWGGGKHK